MLPKNYINNDINGSKRLTNTKRVQLDKIIRQDCIDFFIQVISPKKDVQHNPNKASSIGIESCLNKSKTKADFGLIDAEKINSNIKSLSIIKGDQKSISIGPR